MATFPQLFLRHRRGLAPTRCVCSLPRWTIAALPLLVLTLLALAAGCRGRSASPRWTAPVDAGELTLTPSAAVFLAAPAVVARGAHQIAAAAAIDDGNLEFLVGGDRPGDPLRAVRLEGDGRAVELGTFSALPAGAAGRLMWARSVSGHWWLLASGPRADSPARVWHMEPGAAPQALAFEGLRGAIGFAALVDGGFVVLGENTLAQGAERARRWSLAAFSAAGVPRWTVGSDRDDPAQLHAPVGLAALGDGRIAVLALVRESVQWYSAQGQYEGALDLSAAIGAAPDFLIGLAPGPAGGLLVAQIAPGHPMPRPDGAQRPASERFEEPLVWLDARGQLVARMTPTLPDGAPAATLAARALGTADGRLIAFEGAAVHEIDRAGRARPIWGRAAGAGTLDDPRAAVFGPGGDVHVLDGRSGAVHHFGPDGAALAVYTPDAGDFAEVDLVELERRADGRPVVRTSATRSEWIEFDAAGRRAARHADGFPLGSDGRGGVWRRNGVGLELVTADGAARAPGPRPDGGAVRVAVHASTDTRGALTLLDMAPMALEGCLCFLPVDPAVVPDDGDTGTYIALWDPGGAPERSFRLARDLSGKRVERGGGWVLVAGEGRTVELLRIADGAWYRARLAPKDPANADSATVDPRVRVGLSPDGRHLWALELDNRRILHYPLPFPVRTPPFRN